MAEKHFRIEIDADGIALVIWDTAGRSMNVIDLAVMDELETIIDRVSGEESIKGAVIASGKDAFSGGADLKMLGGMLEAFHTERERDQTAATQRLFDESRRLSQIYRRLETSGKPWVCAINGTAMGGAVELALACHHRVAAENPKAKFGLPEVKVGLFPGAGGTQRVARMMPAADALQYLLQGRDLDFATARKMGLVDEIVPAERLVEAAKAWILGGGSAVKPWDEEKFRLPGGPVYSATGFQVFPAANAIYRRETQNNYPGARAIMSAVYEGLQLPMDAALRVESRYFAHVLQTKEAAAMIRSLFVSMQELNKLARRPADVPASKARKVGVLGAGFMGAAVAYVSAKAGIEVVLIDRDVESAERGKAYADTLVSKDVSRGKATHEAKEELLARIDATADYQRLEGCDLVIEAVFEDRDVKADVIQRAEAVVPETAVIGSNTSTFPISSLAKASVRPERFIGIHFFSPVEKMMLVEVIMGEATGPEALAVALDYCRAIRKTPIVVNDSRGFYTSRVVGTYIREGHLMLAEGVPAAMIENVGRMAGMPVGPLALNDEVAVDLAWKILQATKKDLGESAVEPRQEHLLEEMVVKRGRLGRKNGQGFYDYPDAGKKRLWPGLQDLQEIRLDPDTVDVGELKRRFLVMQALETARCFEEGVLTDVREADVGSILGFGFAPFTGGTLSYVDGMGTKAFVDLCRALEARHGPRFAPNDLLIAMAENGETFYGRFPPTDVAPQRAA
ncbi:3-hydroxyacyl-CoA dehydrogenase NAD-binding domain-containing protein [Lutibaculum baratangense]|uniref:Enoyl-CoA hydratase n=1 Tax=Lutibaculum baratangense AMV1 TaxID=631454 RepID=V4RK56_9HYPH|nr:3-hydroxyacyl-CoA dehydrogenase NAD-binding domain-containing protein [Lutibaculum baratangense]ESR26421.1 Enoyl-CoA hydratase [Lutibaculum baratangense AMV1]